MATKKQIRKAIKSSTPLNDIYRLIPKNKRFDFTIFAQIFGYSRTDIKKILENERKTISK